ncbi:hypothetical protein NIES4071_06720 [Calothrix sp. NIES-4071]|nr:hypothetical protein NIES4071_06720 [Calothrix sp. NIES-4071]BAZ55014.1 hypothetical protein NIES4105_06680 [Calothrix sp. NIES-4105]
MTQITTQGRTLTQSLAIQSQINLPGTVGRILKQIREIERVAPLFSQAGLVRSVDRPNPLNVRVAGISTKAAITKTIGGFLYAAAAVRMDLAVEDNVISTVGQDSTCELDDINYENQSKRLQLIGVRQAYEMAERAIQSQNPYDLILLDCPLMLDRSMVPLREAENYAGYRSAFDGAVSAISKFWSTHRDKLQPWNPQGTAIVGLASERYGAIVHIAQQDLRTVAGRKQILSSENIDTERSREIIGSEDAILGIGERRFIYGILSSYTRTAAFRLNVQTPRMEPSDVVSLGVLGYHYKAAQTNTPQLLQLIGDEPHWNQKTLDKICSQVMALTITGGSQASPLPIQLAEREQQALDSFLKYYSSSLETEIRCREVEDLWLSDLDDL